MILNQKRRGSENNFYGRHNKVEMKKKKWKEIFEYFF